MSGRERFASDLAALVPAGSEPLLILRRECRCTVGEVFRVGGRLVLAGDRLNRVYVSPDRWEEHLVPFLVPDVGREAEPQSYGCKHGGGMLDLGAVAMAARAATRRRTTLKVEPLSVVQ